jgi:hypothetical protein
VTFGAGASAARARKVADQMADPNVIRSAVRTFLTGSRRASGARACGRPPCRACGLAAVPGAAANRRSRPSTREPSAVSSPVATNPTRHCPLDSGTRQGRFASLRDGLRPPWTRPLRRATCSAIGSPARSGHRGSDSCTPRVPPTLQRRHPDQTNHDPAEHVTTGEESPGGLRNEKVRGSNPLSSTHREPRPTSTFVPVRAGFSTSSVRAGFSRCLRRLMLDRSDPLAAPRRVHEPARAGVWLSEPEADSHNPARAGVRTVGPHRRSGSPQLAPGPQGRSALNPSWGSSVHPCGSSAQSGRKSHSGVSVS